MNKRMYLFLVCALVSIPLHAQQFQLKWETAAAPYPSTSFSYVNLGSATGFLTYDSTHVYFYDGITHNLKWTFQKQSYEYPTADNNMVSPVQDYDGNGVKDIWVGGTPPTHDRNTVRLIDPSTGNQLAHFEEIGTQFGPLGLADVDRDGKLELLIERNVSINSGGWSGGDYASISIQVYSTNLSVTSVSNSSQATPNQFQLEQNYPNPFNPSTRIQYRLSERANVQIQIYNLAGQLVKTLLDETKEPGSYSLDWDGKTDNGYRAGSGTYFYRVQLAGHAQTKKMLILR
jgi:hypothetical protein